MQSLKYYFLLPFAFWLLPLSAQEFNCDVTLNLDQLEGNAFGYLPELESKIEEYINDFKWTEFTYEEHERVECQIQLIIESGNSNFDFAGRAIFSTRRPIFNTLTETSTIILSEDSWLFNYPQGSTLIHDELQFENLTGTIDYYMNVLLGYDFDSFSELGGTPYFQRAQNIVDLAQTTSSIGWSRTANNRRNKVTLIADLLNPSYEPLRIAYYKYHRLGLDTFTTSPEQSRESIIEVLTSIRDVKRRVTSNFLFDLFFDTKSREIAGIFNEAEANTKRQAYSILLETDQGHLSDYSGLQN